MLGTHNSGIGNNYPNTSVYNAWGDPITHSLCPFNSDVVDHFINLSRDVVNLGVFDKILIESLEYLPLRHGHHHEVIGVDFSADIDFIMSLNFSNKCLEALKQKNIDGEMIRNLWEDCSHCRYHFNFVIQYFFINIIFFFYKI